MPPREATIDMIDAGKWSGDVYIKKDESGKPVTVPRHDNAEIINIWRAMWDVWALRWGSK